MINQVAQLIVVALFVREIGLSLFGVWALVTVITGYIELGDLGLTLGLQKALVKARKEKRWDVAKQVVSCALWLFLFLGAIAGGGIYVFAGAIVEFAGVETEEIGEALAIVKVTGLYVFLIWLQKVFQLVYNAEMRQFEFGLLRSAQVLLSNTVLGISIFYFDDAAFGRAGMCVVWFVMCFPMLLGWQRWFSYYRISFRGVSLSVYRSCSAFSLGMFYKRLLTQSAVKVDTIVIGAFLASSSIGIYQVLYKPFLLVTQVVGIVFSMLDSIVYNLSDDSATEEGGRLRVLVRRGVRARCLIATMMSLPLILVLDELLVVWVGEWVLEYAVWGKLFLIVPILSSPSVVGAIARNLGHMAYVNTVSTIKVLLNICLSIWLVQSYGVGGVIIGSVLAGLVFPDIFVSSLFARRMNVSWWAEVGAGYFRIVLVNAALFAFLFGALSLVEVASVMRLICAYAIVLVLFCVVNYICVLSVEEKRDVGVFVSKIANIKGGKI